MRPSGPPVTVLVCALGGEGGGVLAEWLYGAAVRAGHAAQSTSIPGVAQRTGATTYYVEVAPAPLAAGAPRPVFGLAPVPGGVDLLVSSELLETARQVAAGMASRERTQILSSTARALTVAEKMALTDGRADAAKLVGALQRHAAQVDLLDFGTLARESGTAISAVLLGAIAASGVLPLPRAAYEEQIRASGKGVAASLRGFALAFDTLRQRQDQQAAAVALVQDMLPAAAPAASPDLRALARQRLRDYQDEAYARLYDERLARLEAAERAADPAAARGGAIVQEATRWLALWMAFDDIVRVAALKLAASRLARVRREVGARDDEIVRVYDHFKPGVPEFAALLPAPLASRLLAWDRRRIAAGREPWALPLKVGAHGVFGALALRFVAALKGQRRRGSRFALEQSLIERWLAAVERGTREHWALGHELAQCGRLVKGYGSTNERGKDNLLHIVDHLAAGPQPAAERAAAVRAAREAALADDAGRALDATLVAFGAPKRPPREQVVRWFRRRPEAAAPVR
ncbi:MAG: indolepyruvate oxidoreductase subunit beta family protein [Rubrivivax sp.]|nr:indolepyruvate oxidoreductase subunit beta family protein [Rubrivivax sp.]